jgi:hypothetical protein
MYIYVIRFEDQINQYLYITKPIHSLKKVLIFYFHSLDLSWWDISIIIKMIEQFVHKYYNPRSFQYFDETLQLQITSNLGI